MQPELQYNFCLSLVGAFLSSGQKKLGLAHYILQEGQGAASLTLSYTAVWDALQSCVHIGMSVPVQGLGLQGLGVDGVGWEKKDQIG